MQLTKAQEREIRDLVAAGMRIPAVKRCREITGLGLNDALQVVNGLAFGRSVEEAPKSLHHTAHSPAAARDPKATRNAEAAAMVALREGHVLEAVKQYRRHTGLGLKEAKDEVDILHLVHHSSARVNPKVAKALIAALSAGNKQEALTQLMAGAGYDDTEARTFIASLGRLGIARTGCGRGCLRVILNLLLLIGLAVAARLAGWI